MSAFVEECRREWSRLGVPDRLAEETATELESDLAEAEADGISAAEILGESDPRRFAAMWARERGLVSEPTAKRSRKGLWIGLAVGLFFLLTFSAWIALQTSDHSATHGVRVTPRVRVNFVRVPNLVGEKACAAERTARDAGLTVRNVPKGRCDASVVEQTPAPGERTRRHSAVNLRLRG